MVVLQLGPYPPPHGGVQTNLVAIREHLRRHQVSAPVINLTRHRREDADEVYYPRTALQVVKLLWSIRADVIHLHFGGQLTSRLLGLCLVATLVPGRRTVLTFHSGGYASGKEGQAARARSLAGYVFRRLDAVIAVNKEIEGLFRRLGVPASRIHLICPYTPVSVPGSGLPERLRSFRESHDPVISTVGLLEPEYDLSLQIRTLPLVRRAFPDAGLVIIGSGRLESELRAQIAAQPDASHILLCGDVPHADTVAVMHRSDVFLRTTHYDGDSVSVREALQLGVPVIATDNGMRPPRVRLLRDRTELAVAAAIEEALRNPAPGSSPVPAAAEPLDETLDLYSRLTGRVVRAPAASISTKP